MALTIERQGAWRAAGGEARDGLTSAYIPNVDLIQALQCDEDDVSKAAGFHGYGGVSIVQVETVAERLQGRGELYPRHPGPNGAVVGQGQPVAVTPALDVGLDAGHPCKRTVRADGDSSQMIRQTSARVGCVGARIER